MGRFMGELQCYYMGRQWDAPMTDGAIEKDLSGRTCVICREAITSDQNAFEALQTYHTECNIRSIMGDVQHLEGRCICSRPNDPIELDSDNYETYRESAIAAVQWLIDHRQGRFHD